MTHNINERLKRLLKFGSTIVYQNELTYISELIFRGFVKTMAKDNTYIIYFPKSKKTGKHIPKRGARSAINQLIKTGTITFR